MNINKNLEFFLQSLEHAKSFPRKPYALQRHNTEYSKQIFPEKELRDHSPNIYIHVSVLDLYFVTMDLPILLQE